MKLIVDRIIKLANGEAIPAGTEIHITVEKKRPTFAELFYTPVGVVRISCANLHLYFNDFVNPTEDIIMEALCDAVCPSIFCGYDVEPDGWDVEGFPSVLLALGM
jgi:hypothetical protein